MGKAVDEFLAKKAEWARERLAAGDYAALAAAIDLGPCACLGALEPGDGRKRLCPCTLRYDAVSSVIAPVKIRSMVRRGSAAAL